MMAMKLRSSMNFSSRSGLALFACLIFWVCPLFAQVKPLVSSEVDTTNIKIGEQIQFTVTVETDSTAQVIFPEGQTFSPLETVEAFKTDTTRKKDRITLQKIYALTQFDSGSYLLPAQRIEINGVGFFTDSMEIGVATVPVDTVNQKMYDIKPLISVQKSNSDFWKILLIVLLVGGIAGGLIYWFIIRKKPLTEEEKVALLPPYDRALLELKRLENSKYLIQDKYKKYYSELTAIVRSYLEEEVHVSALESTTSQLIQKLELLQDAGELKLQDNTIKQFEKILQTADLVKFARSKPPTSVAEQDRKAIKEILVKTKEALPEPTEEELLEKEEYQEIIAQKNRKKKIISIISAAAIVLLVSLGGLITYLGPSYVWDTITGHPTKTLLEGEWVSSSYGYPRISIESPEVLVRQKVKLPPDAKANIKELQAFMYRNEKSLFTIGTTSTTLNKSEEPDFNQVVEEILKNFEDQGAKNIITKQEEFTTKSGIKGIKVFGRGNFAAPGSGELVRGQYTIILFGGNGFQQQLILSWPDKDSYAEEIVDRVIGSLEVKTEA